MSLFIDCINCDQEITIESLSDKCPRCGQPATSIRQLQVYIKNQAIERENNELKGEEMSEQDHEQELIKEISASMPPVPAKPNLRENLPAYYEQHKEDIIADYYAMPILEFLARWRISTITWGKLRLKWAVLGKQHGGARIRRPQVDNKAPENEKQYNPTSELSEHDQLLILKGYQMAVREFLASGAK